MERYWVWEYGLFEKNPKRVDSLNPETTLEVVKLADAQATVEALQAQLRLANIDQANAEARANDLQQQVEALQRERDEARDFLNTVANDLNDQAAALDAEREKVANLDAMYRQQLGDRDKRIEALAGSAKIWMERYTQLRALVRAFVDSIQPVDCVEVDELLREARATLDVTMPAAKGGDSE